MGYKLTHGATQFTLIPLSPTSLAADFVMPMTPCFAAVYAAFLGKPISPAILEAFIIEPRSFMFRICALMQCITAILVSLLILCSLGYCSHTSGQIDINNKLPIRIIQILNPLYIDAFGNNTCHVHSAV